MCSVAGESNGLSKNSAITPGSLSRALLVPGAPL